ncbi:hypothetical protein AALP_AAs74023U000200 [Arabis alpina]|uniref:ADP-ribosyl cyclase/cyclic ADP-ribose hydrolase n=1 Tax=Arabis alpina TaxID=50452 RepID=A0A087FW91_ARAAL|nr:hypothetical protein AALP_AAs74023U000200 [Arabis alpina]
MATHEKPSPKRQVFINFWDADFRSGVFVNHLENALLSDGVNVYGDESSGGDFNGIEESSIALVIFSSRYTESRRCLEELVKIKEGMEQGKIMVIPIFYKLDTSIVKGEFEGGSDLNLLNPAMRDFEPELLKIWKEALDSVSCMMGFQLYKNSDESKFISRIVKDVIRLLTRISMEEQIHESHDRLNEQQKDAFMDSSKSERVDGNATSGVNQKEVESVQHIDETVESVNEGKKQEKVGKSSTMVTFYKPPPEHKVFINFRGSDLLHSFVGHLVEAFKRVGLSVFTDEGETLSGNELLLKRIEESRIAIVIFSSGYTESTCCLDELLKIKERMDEGKLLVIPIFYKLKPLQVRQLEGNFGVRLWNLWRTHREHRIIKWKEALESVGGMMGFLFEEDRSEGELITSIVKEVINSMIKRSSQRRKIPSFSRSTGREESTELATGKGENLETYLNNHPLFGIKLRMEQLEQKLQFDCNETQIIGVVGMPGIGKTTLAMKLYEKWNCNFVRCMPLLGIRKKSKDHEPVWFRETLLEVLLEGKFPVIRNETTHESVKDILLQTKVFVVLDDVSDKKQLNFLLGKRDWIKKGSKIVITTCDKSLLEGFADDTYVVPLLNDREAFQLFSYHAFDDQIYCPTGTFLTLSRMFVDYAGGHPLALILLGIELRGKDEAHWEQRVGIETHSYNKKIQDLWRFSIDQLSERQKDVFLDIVYFFMSEDEYFVRSLLDSGDPDGNDPVSDLRDLAEKFLITISDGRVEMNDLLYRFSKGLGSPLRHRLWNHKNIYKLQKMNETEANNVRGIFLDMSEVTETIALESMTFTSMRDLRYLKIHDSCCPQQCKADCKLYFPNGLKFPLEEVRYLHWVKFPLKELPPDFRTENLVDLRLPYSKIERVWDSVKDAPRLKWVDLSHSSNLLNLSALLKAASLQRLNLEGCTNLDELPGEIQNMKSLVFLNLRGCIRLSSLPEMNLISLKTLILSGCANLEEFQLISESLEVLHLEGTSIKGLPPTIKNLQRLILLNLKNCKLLECLPNCLGELGALEELILSGCSRLKNLSDVREGMKHLHSLLIDMIGAKEMPNISRITGADMVFQHFHPNGWPGGVNRVSSLQRLCLSGNDFVTLHTDICQLHDLKWLEVKECKKLRSLPMLPPKLQYFDAHGCESLERVANPLALPVLLEQVHATFSFSNCNMLDQDATNSIISYTRWKSQLVLNALSRYNGGSVLKDLTRTCFPGWEVPAWFSHRASGSLLKPKLLPHWCDNGVIGIALSAVILYPGYHEQKNRLVVTCNCVFKNGNGSHIRFSCSVGSWSEQSNTPLKLESSHVFIGYTTMLDKYKRGMVDDEEGCIFTEASLEFQVTDGTEEVVGCKVLSCGFKLVYASAERENTCSDAKNFAIAERIENVPSEEKSHEYESYSGLTLGTDDNFSSQAKSDTNPNLQKTLKGKRVELLNVENDAGREITGRSYQEHYFVGVELRLKQMEKVLYSTPGETCIVGVVGMPDIGKTTLATILFEKRGSKFPSHLFLPMLKECGPKQLRRMFLKELLKHINQNISDETTHEFVKDELLQTKVFAVLDGVSDKTQLEFLLGNLDWIKKGSKIVITTCKMSLLEGFAHDTYVIPQLNSREAFQLFSYHAFGDQISSPTGTFVSLSRRFVDNARGNPRALKLLGSGLRDKDEAYWEDELKRVEQSFNKKMRDVWRFSIDQLNERQKDVFGDILYFFRSEEEYLVRSLLDSGNLEAVSEVRDLANKFLITISGGRVEIHDRLYTLDNDLGSPGRYKLQNYKDIIDKITKMEQREASNVRGIFLDMSEVTENIALESMTFTSMPNLRYLKIYDSCCPQQCKAECKLYFPDGLEFPLEKVRYLHWVKFPLEELPPDFRPENLVDLRLPYSKIERVWEGVKDAPQLKWVDLCHSSKLLNLSALSMAENLETLNLEGCTVLNELPVEIQNMKSLIFLNLKGCIRLWSLPKMNLISLKTLILSDCSNLKEFQVVSESIEFLHLDGTAIKELPLAIQNLQRLIVLDLKNCKMLECLPNCLRELKALEELILSGCSRLKNLSDVRESMKHLQSLLIDRIGAKEMPNISSNTISEGQASAGMVLQPFGLSGWPRLVNRVSSLRRLCLSGNDFVNLQSDIGNLYNLNWLDVKECKMLRSIPILPPRLQYFDARDCESLERVANPLAIPVPTHHIHATFNFSNCNRLEQDAKDNIISYIRWKGQLVLDALSRYNGASIVESFTGTCFPGWEVPAWFSHQASGSVLKPKLPPHWSDTRFTGIALCAVILFPDYHEERNRLLVKCNCVFKNEDGSHISFSCTVGGWSEPGKTPGKVEASHVFIGYAGMLDLKKDGGEEDKVGCNHINASFEFQVTDGTEELEDCEVLKCGVSLVYASDELRVKFGVCGAPAEANHYRAFSNSGVAISSVRKETETAERQPDGGYGILELPNKTLAHGIFPTPQTRNTKSPVPPPEFGSRSNSLERERHVQLTGEPQVFVSCHGADLRVTFVKHLVSTLTNAGVNVYIDNDTRMWLKEQKFYMKIEESKIAVVIFSKRYLASKLCLDELVKMVELAEKGKLLVIPVFYQVRFSDVKNLKGEFGRRFKEMRGRCKDEPEKVLKWETSLKFITKTQDIQLEVHGIVVSVVEATVQAVQRELAKISGGKPKFLGSGPVFFLALFAVFLFSLFIALLLFTDAKLSAFW